MLNVAAADGKTTGKCCKSGQERGYFRHFKTFLLKAHKISNAFK